MNIAAYLVCNSHLIPFLLPLAACQLIFCSIVLPVPFLCIHLFLLVVCFSFFPFNATYFPEELHPCVLLEYGEEYNCGKAEGKRKPEYS